MEPEGLLPCSNEPSTSLILSHINTFHTTPAYLRLIFILSRHLGLGLPSGLFPFGFPTYILYAILFYSFHVLYPAPPILFHLIILIMFG
jgi:hypothetical protein